MKREDLFEAIGDVDDRFLEENVAPAGRRNWLPAVACAAACVGVIAAAAALLPSGRPIETEPERNVPETAVLMTEPHVMGAPESGTNALAEETALVGHIAEDTEQTAAETAKAAAVTESLTVTITSQKSETTVVVTTQPEAEDVRSFRYVLTQIYENRSFMDVPFDTDASDISGNQFAIYDVDGDSADELVFLWKETQMACVFGMIYGHDAQGNITMEFWGNPFIHIYSNGLIKADASHNQGLDGRFWPYTLCRYDAASDTYVTEYSVGAWDSEVLPAPEEAYPAEADVSGSGIVYYIGDRGPLDITEFEAWEAETFGDAYELDLPFQSFTLENIASVQQ